MRRNRVSLKKLEVLLEDNKKQREKLEALLKDNIKQREELVNLHGKAIETQERLEEMASVLKMKEAESKETVQRKRGIAYALGWTEERALVLAVLVMYMLMMALGREVCGW